MRGQIITPSIKNLYREYRRDARARRHNAVIDVYVKLAGAMNSIHAAPGQADMIVCSSYPFHGVRWRILNQGRELNAFESDMDSVETAVRLIRYKTNVDLFSETITLERVKITASFTYHFIHW